MILEEQILHVEATRASDVHKIAVGGLNKTLQLVLLGLFLSRRITEIVHLNCVRLPPVVV